MPKQRGLIDTSVLIALEIIDPDLLPSELAVSAISLAELAAGPHAARDPVERSRRQERLQRVEAAFVPLAFDAPAARAFGLLYAGARAAGRKTRGRRSMDMLIAATAAASDLSLYTRNAADFAGLSDVLQVISV